MKAAKKLLEILINTKEINIAFIYSELKITHMDNKKFIQGRLAQLNIDLDYYNKLLEEYKE